MTDEAVNGRRAALDVEFEARRTLAKKITGFLDANSSLSVQHSEVILNLARANQALQGPPVLS